MATETGGGPPVISQPLGGGVVTATGSTTARSLAARFADVVNVKDFGAVGDGVADDTAEIQAAIDYAVSLLASYHAPEVVFPPGIYLVTSTINVGRSHIRLVGQSRVVGAIIRGGTSGMGDVIKVTYTGGGFGIYGFQMLNLRVDATPALGVPPNGLHLFEASEFLIDNCYFGFDLADGIKFNGVGGGIVRATEASTNAVGFHFTNVGTAIFTTSGNTWLEHLNIYSHTDSAIKIDASFDRLTIRDCWAENSPFGLNIVQTANADMVVSELLVDNFVFANGGSSPYTTAAVRFVRAQAMNTATYSFTLNRPVFRDCMATQTQATPSPYNVQFDKNSNSHGNTSVSGVVFENGNYRGASSALLNSDFYTPGSFRGAVRAVDQANATIPLHTTGTYPISADRVLVGAVANNNGDANATLTIGLPTVQRWSTTLTANRTVTLSTTGAANGDSFRIVRSAEGAFGLDVGGLVTLFVPGWVEVQYDGSAWVVTGGSTFY